MTEEYQELIEELDAMHSPNDEINPEKVMKELCDVLYVVFGFASRYKELKYLDEAFLRVHGNNMEKLEKGTVRHDGKIVKPAGHLPPDLSDLIEKGVNDG
jgi:predicted HAD superfamily Cof-like phosphohydrolase